MPLEKEIQRNTRHETQRRGERDWERLGPKPRERKRPRPRVRIHTLNNIAHRPYPPHIES